MRVMAKMKTPNNSHKHWQYRLNISTNETFNEIENRIISTCGINLSDKGYVLEIYDDSLEQYVVLTQRYLTELYKSLLVTPIQTLDARLSPRHLEDVPSQVPIPSSNHSIVWLDKSIGESHDYQLLKQKFSLMLDLGNSSYLPSDGLGDIDNLMMCEREQRCAALYTFGNPEECIRFVQTNATSTAIFFVISSSLSRFIIPTIAGQVRAIYVRRYNVEEEIKLTSDYRNSSCHILIYDHDTDFLARLARDVADYCIEQGLAAKHLTQAFNFFLDAEKMFIRAHIIDGKNIDNRLDNIYQQFQQVTDQTPNEYDYSKTNHLILWLDINIADPGAYAVLKNAFSKNTDPHNPTSTTLTAQDYYELLRMGDVVPIMFMGVYFLIQACDSIDACLTAFERHQDKRIFFITSSSMGSNIVPIIIQRYRHIFTNAITNDPFASIYIVSSNVAQQIEWDFEYREYIIMSDRDAQLLDPMINDIIDYFIGQSKRFRQKHDAKKAFRHLKCATEVWYQYSKMERDTFMNPFQRYTETDRIKKINKLIAEATASSLYTQQDDGTKFAPEEIERSEQDSKSVGILYLHVGKNKTDEGNFDTIRNRFVGLQKVEFNITEFRDVKRCLTYISRSQNAKIGLILSNGLNEDEMSILNRCSNVNFIFQLDSPFPWIKEGASTGLQSSNSLITQRLYAYHRLLDPDIGLYAGSRKCVELPAQRIVKDEPSFIYYQLLMEILLRIQITEESKNDFINWSHEHYSQNSAQRNAIDLFASTFKPSESIVWYTRDSFVYRILNRTFRTNNLRLIFKTRYFICHLHRALEKLHTETFTILDPQICVYRGTQMSRKAFDVFKASKGKRVITECFLSATLDKKVAACFSGMDQVMVGNVSVIFIMIINTFRNKSKPFALIQHISTMKDEAEFLIAPGVIFKNCAINQIGENIFEVVLTNTLAEEELREEINRSIASYLERARNVESVDEFEALIVDASNKINQQEIPSLSELHDRQRKTRPIEPRPAPTTEPQIIHQVKEHLSEKHFSSLRKSLPASKRVYTDVRQLRLSNTHSDGSTIFIVDRTPFDDDDSLLSNVIMCRIFPYSNIYNQCAYQIEITLLPTYPFDPPEVRFLTPIYHPNVTKDGQLCMNILRKDYLWTFKTSLTSVLIAVVDLIDNPNIDAAVNINIALEYVENRAEFNRKAFDMVTKYGLRR